MSFRPASGYIEVRPIEAGSVLKSDDGKWVEKAEVIVGKDDIDRDDIVFFRPHGFFELAEHNGEKHYVVRVSEEFILGIFKRDVAKE